MSAARNAVLAPKAWMNRRSCPATLTISVWLVSAPGGTARADTSTRLARGLSAAGRPKTAAPTRPGAGGGPRELPRAARKVGRAAADGQDEPVGQDELARGGQVVDGRADVVGHDNAGTQDVRGRAHGGPRASGEVG